MQISIVIATFNAAKVLPKALSSILNQSFQDWECIIVDGASNDSTIDIIKAYQQKDSRFRYISEPDQGVYDAFNKGWKMAKGEWIYYLGADDILLDSALENVSRQFDNSDMIYGNMVFDTGLRIKHQKYTAPKVYKKGWMVSHQAIFMRRTCIEELGGFDIKYKISADFALIQKAIIAQKVFKHIECYIAKFQCGGVSSNSFANILEAYRIDKEYHLSKNIFFAWLLMIKRVTYKYFKLKIKSNIIKLR